MIHLILLPIYFFIAIMIASFVLCTLGHDPVAILKRLEDKAWEMRSRGRWER